MVNMNSGDTLHWPRAACFIALHPVREYAIRMYPGGAASARRDRAVFGHWEKRTGPQIPGLSQRQRRAPPAGVVLRTIALLAFGPSGTQPLWPPTVPGVSDRQMVRNLPPGSSLDGGAGRGVAFRRCATRSSHLVLCAGDRGGYRAEREDFSVCSMILIVIPLWAAQANMRSCLHAWILTLLRCGRTRT